MGLIKRSRNSVWRVWSGDWRIGVKGNKKRVGVHVGINIRSDKMPQTFSETAFVNDVSELLTKYAVKFDPSSSMEEKFLSELPIRLKHATSLSPL